MRSTGGGWETITNDGIAIDVAERDETGHYVVNAENGELIDFWSLG